MPEKLIDVTRLVIRLKEGRLPTGVDRVCLAYVKHFGSTARAVLRRSGFGGILSQSASQDLFALLLEPSKDFTRRAVSILFRSPPLPLSTNKHGGSILFNIGHSGLERPEYAAWLVRKRLRPLFMVHDLIPISHPEYCRAGEGQRHRVRMDTVLGTAAGVITNSSATLKVLAEYATTVGLTMPPTVAAPLAAWTVAPSATALTVDTPYFVILGTIEPRKNHLMLLQVWRRLVEQHGKRAPRLLVIGQRGWECENALDLLERCESLRGIVTEYPDCSDADLAALLKSARALLFPSFVEGYGLPLIESLALGTPAIASDLPVFREIAGQIPDYLDPLDSLGWLARIEEFSDPASPRRSAQLDRLQHFIPPTWSEHFALVENLIRNLA